MNTDRSINTEERKRERKREREERKRGLLNEHAQCLEMEDSVISSFLIARFLGFIRGLFPSCSIILRESYTVMGSIRLTNTKYEYYFTESK